MSRKLFSLASILILLVTALSACAPTEVIRTVEVLSTQIVTQIVEGEVQEVVITATPQPTEDLSNEPVNLRFTVWTSNEAQLALLNGIGEEYTKLHPNVTVQIDPSAFDDYTSKLSIQLAGGDPPDAGWMLETAAANWIKAGAIVDLAPTLNATEDYNYADFSEPAMSFWVRDEAVYGVPFSTSPFFVMYNANLFAAAGIPTPDELMASGEWTFEKFTESAKTITEKGGKDVYGFLGVEASSMFTQNPFTTLTPFVWAYGGELWSTDFTTCGFNSPETVEALSLIQQMLVTDKSMVPAGQVSTFSAGNIGMAFGQLSRVGPLKDVTWKWGLAPLPTGPGGYAPTIGQAAVTVFKASPNPEVAKDFVAFLTNEENVTKMAAYWPPARESVLNTDIMKTNNPHIDPAQFDAAITDSIMAGKVVTSHPDFAKVDLTFRPYLDKLWAPEGNDVQTNMDEACKILAPYFK